MKNPLFWPNVDTEANAKKLLWYGVVSALFSAIITALLAAWSLGARKQAFGFITPFAFIDAIIFLALAFWIYKGSRVATIVALGYFLLEKVWQIQRTGALHGAWLAIILVICYLIAIRGAFALHHFRNKVSTKPGTVMSRLRPWQFKARAQERRMARTLREYGLSVVEATNIAGYVFGQYNNFQSLPLNTLYESTSLNIEISHHFPVAVEYLSIDMRDDVNEAGKRRVYWHDFISIETARTVAAMIAKKRNLTYDDLDKETKHAFNLGGILATDWDVIRASECTHIDGVDYITGNNIKNQDIATKCTTHLYAAADIAAGTVR